MDQSDPGAYVSLVDYLLELNKDIIDPSQINMGIARAVSEGAPLDGVEISDDIKVSCTIEDTDQCLNAVSHVIRIIHDFISVIMDPETAEESVLKPLVAYVEEHGYTEVLDSLDDLVATDGSPADMGDKTDTEKIATIYLDCISLYLADSKKDYSKHLRNLFSSIAKVEMEDGAISVALEPVDGIVPKMSEAFNEFVELFFSLEGKDLDIPKEEKRIKAILEPYGSLPKDLGITKTILFGSLAPTISTGLSSIDHLLGGGIPRGESAVLRVPPGWECEVLTRRFIRAGLLAGSSVVVVLSSMSPVDFRVQMDNMGIDVERFEKKGRLRIVDWYSHNYRRVVGIERDGYVTMCTQDLTNLSISLDSVLREMADAPVKLGVVEIVSPALLRSSFEPVYELVQAINSKFKKALVSGVVVLARGIHKMENFHSISDIFSTTIDLERIEKDIGGELSMAASSIASSTRDRLSVSWTKRGMVLEGGKDMETVPLSYEKNLIGLGIKGMDRIGSGILQGRTVLLQAPECTEKEQLVSSFLQIGFKKKKSIVVLASMSTDDFISLQPEGSVPEETLFVDWYSHKNEKIIGVEKRGNTYFASQDIAHFAIALRKAVDEVGEEAYILMDTLTSLLKYYDLSSVVSFTMAMKGVFRNKKATTLFTFDAEAFDKEYANTFTYLLDQTISIREERGFGGEKFIWIPTFKDGYSTGNKALCVLSDDDELSFDTLEMVIKKAKGAVQGDVSATVLEALSKENEMLKRDLAAVEAEIGVQANAGHQARVAELEAELARLKEELFSDAKELASVLSIIDEMFENLPEDVLEKFTTSDDFSIYERIVDKYALSREFEE